MRRTMYGVISVVVILLVRLSEASLVACPSTVEGNVLVAHQFECSSFFLCDRSGSKPSFLLRCPTGSHFDEGGIDGACVDSAGVQCQPGLRVNRAWDGRSAGPLPPIDSPDSYRNYTMHLPHPTNCSRFYRYEGWSDPALYECPDDLRFDPVLEVCDLPHVVDCRGRECQNVAEPRCPPTNESVVHLPHPTECGAYYVCNWGQPILMRCPDDLYFNPELGVCDWPRNVECNRCPQRSNDNGSVDDETTDRSNL